MAMETGFSDLHWVPAVCKHRAVLAPVEHDHTAGILQDEWIVRLRLGVCRLLAALRASCHAIMLDSTLLALSPSPPGASVPTSELAFIVDLVRFLLLARQCVKDLYVGTELGNPLVSFWAVLGQHCRRQAALWGSLGLVRPR